MKNNRQQTILSLIKQKKIRTHDQLVEELAEFGFVVTQATVSRDIKQLGIVKIPDGEGSIYAAPKEWENVLQKYAPDVTDVVNASNIIVIHTKPGMASAVASVVDSEMHSDIIGSIAGDDTIFIVVHDSNMAEELAEKLRQYFTD